MPIKIINLRVPSYPLIGFGLFTLLQCTKPCDACMEVDLYGYLSQETALTLGTLFAIGSRWIVRAAAKTPEAPTLNFNRNFAFEIGAVPLANLAPGLCHFVVGFGQVHWKAKIPNPNHCQKSWLGWLHPSSYRMRPSDSNSGARHRDKTHQAFDVRYIPQGKGPLRHAFNLAQEIQPAGTAGINRSNTAARAVLEQPCSTGGRTDTVRPKREPTGRTDLSDRSRLVLCNRSQELIGQACPTRRQVLRSDSACPTTGRTRLFEHRSNCRVRPVNAGIDPNQPPARHPKVYPSPPVARHLQAPPETKLPAGTSLKRKAPDAGL
ncbi:hypothetical protein PCANC_27662 [Puccinia coronata f. sp. avenae]|uniref:Uncharacterized protein n=1 Tax=Puccinia coronata f. sp. avenae TaxID=200324 RepID=A0A2N5RWJ3_9BASI|nr:hypothetical protein PCANC_27662 [Puccinia coronata f. sp. avenae]